MAISFFVYLLAVSLIPIVVHGFAFGSSSKQLGVMPTQWLYRTVHPSDFSLRDVKSEPLDDERIKIWKTVSKLEKRAIDLLASSDEDHNDAVNRKLEVDAIKLLIQSVMLRNSDPFIQSILTHFVNVNANSHSDFADNINQLAVELQGVGLPPHIKAAVNNRKKKTFLDLQGDATKIEEFKDEDIDIGSNFSDTVTDGIRVKVTSFYDSKSSDPASGLYIFWYKVGIFNEGKDIVQVVGRTWEIEKFNGEREIFRGNGVKNSQPIIAPGGVFTYQSTCPLRMMPPKGKRMLAKMGGSYLMSKGVAGQEPFSAKIDQFNLILPSSVK